MMSLKPQGPSVQTNLYQVLFIVITLELQP